MRTGTLVLCLVCLGSSAAVAQTQTICAGTSVPVSDTHCSLAFAKLYLSKVTMTAVDVLNDRVRGKVVEPKPYPGAAKYCDEHVLGAPGSGQINWTGYHTADPPEKVVAFYLEQHGPDSHERLDDSDIWRFPPDKPQSVLTVTTPKGVPHSNLCKPIPGTARTAVIISRIFRP